MFVNKMESFTIKNGGVLITNIWKAIVKIARIKNDKRKRSLKEK